MKHYRSSIPHGSEERIISNRSRGQQGCKAEYFLDGEMVGVRQFDANGQIEFERPVRNGVPHGTLYYIDGGVVTFAEPYRNGLPHGVARQWSTNGRLLGSYAMKRGTGLDLWRCEMNNGPVYLSEVRHLKNGNWHGFEWWFTEDEKSLHSEHHFRENSQHGIERHWNAEGRLQRGYPRYWVKNNRVTKRQYLRACDTDSSLPPFRESDNRPRRKFPPAVLAAMSRNSSR
jgi:antitoxin component YwqK of YwqJK toxin-antitoxin module